MDHSSECFINIHTIDSSLLNMSKEQESCVCMKCADLISVYCSVCPEALKVWRCVFFTRASWADAASSSSLQDSRRCQRSALQTSQRRNLTPSWLAPRLRGWRKTPAPPSPCAEPETPETTWGYLIVLWQRHQVKSWSFRLYLMLIFLPPRSCGVLRVQTRTNTSDIYVLEKTSQY